MAEADFDFIRNASGTAPVGGPSGRSVIHDTLTQPLILEGEFGRRYVWETGNPATSQVGVIDASVDGGIWSPGGTTHGFDVWAAVRVQGAGTPNKAAGLSVKTGRIGTVSPYTSLPSGYHLFVGGMDINGVTIGSPTALTLLLVNESADGDQGGTGLGYRALTVTSGLETDVWHYIRLSVVPNGGTEDIVKCYTGRKNVGLNASIVTGAPTGSSGAAASMGAPFDPGVPPAGSNFAIPVTGLSGLTFADVGRYINFSGATDPLNNGDFRIYNVIDPTEIEIVRKIDATGALETPGNESGLDWSTRQMRVSNLANLTDKSVGRALTLGNATAPGNLGTFFITAANGAEADVLNPDAVIPDLNNGDITWIEGAPAPAVPTAPIWTDLVTEVVASTENYYCAWGDATSRRIGFFKHNASPSDDAVYLDAFNATRDAV